LDEILFRDLEPSLQEIPQRRGELLTLGAAENVSGQGQLVDVDQKIENIGRLSGVLFQDTDGSADRLS
jgi:hypothetical protein